MLTNGNRIIILRIAVSGLISMTALIGAGLLAWEGIDVPYAWWLVTLVTVGGVAGSDIIDVVLTRTRKEESNGNRT